MIRMQPSNADAHIYRGVLRLYQNKDKDAEADFKKAFQLNPGLKKKLQPFIDEARAKARAKD